MDEQDEVVQLRKSDLSALREQAKLLKDLQPQFEALQREQAFVKAGIDMSNPLAKYFVRGYDGKVDSESIREAAERDGLMRPPQSPQVPQQELQNHQRAMDASSGEPAIQDGFVDAMAKANSVEEVMLAAGKLGHPTVWNRRDY